MLGASGAIAAVLGAFMVLYPGARITTLALVFVVHIPAWFYLGAWFVMQLLDAHAALVSPSAAGNGVAFFAHVGGFVFGAIFTLGATRRTTPRGATAWPGDRAASALA